MARRIYLKPHFTTNELAARYRSASDPIERSHWHFLWLLSCGFTATTIAAVTGYSAYWIGQMARRYNREGPDGVRDRRHCPKTGTPLLSQDRQQDLRNALAGPTPGGDQWCGRTVAYWMGERLRRQISRQTGWRWLRRLGARWRKPRPRHIGADLVAQRRSVLRKSGRITARQLVLPVCSPLPWGSCRDKTQPRRRPKCGRERRVPTG
jgi:transposase